MNLVWILGLALIVAVEKLSPWGDRLARPLGAGLVAAGLALMTRAFGAG
jgi:predicted metal-binding membrane protein